MKDIYKKQVSLLLDILPDVAKEEVFALHGGTAINLFCLNMPRLSVDIDLTYIPASESRDADLQNIRSALERIKERLRKRISGISLTDPIRAEEELKLICATPNAMVKIEVNQINRGIIADTELVVLCDVNEQNEQAIGFYIYKGFSVAGRSELDGTGKPYPILHLKFE